MAGFSPGVTAHAAYDPHGILVHAGAARRIDTVTLLSGEVGVAGHLLGKITSGGKYKIALAASSDGSQLPAQMAILLDACDASGGDKVCRVLIGGDFDATKVTFGTGFTFAAIKDYLAHAGLHGHTSYAVTE
jgi:hypothetical protein